MNILMVTNTFTPHVGGVARSVEAYADEYRRRGHRVLVVAPDFENQPAHETDVVRVPAIQHFNGSDFSVALPIPRFLTSRIEAFEPDLVHSHHPFLLGATAARIAHFYDRPLVFTHHTLYERYTHYVPGDSPALKRFVIDLATHYANMCDRVVAPSSSVASLLKRRGVHVAISVIPTGVRLDRFATGDGAGFRAANGIRHDAFVVGHVGRLAPEKNLSFLSAAVSDFLLRHPEACFLVAGRGTSEAGIRTHFESQGLGSRFCHVGNLVGSRLADAYHAMNVFAFSSKSETQGMVLTEAMAAGVPVVAVDASGVWDVVRDQHNGRLLDAEANEAEFRQALEWVLGCSPEQGATLVAGARATAGELSLERTADASLALYEDLMRQVAGRRQHAFELWSATRRLIATEWDLLTGLSEAAGAALHPRAPEPDSDR